MTTRYRNYLRVAWEDRLSRLPTLLQHGHCKGPSHQLQRKCWSVGGKAKKGNTGSLRNAMRPFPCAGIGETGF
jgi:hypothetical protein